MSKYETVLVKERIHLLDLHLVNKKKNIYDLLCEKHVLAKSATSETAPLELDKPPPKPAIAEYPSVIISDDGDFVYLFEHKCRTCMLSPKQRKLVRAVADAEDRKLDGNVAFKLLGLKRGEDAMLRNMISSINRELAKRSIPVKFSFSDWHVRIIRKATT